MTQPYLLKRPWVIHRSGYRDAFSQEVSIVAEYFLPGHGKCRITWHAPKGKNDKWWPVGQPSKRSHAGIILAELTAAYHGQRSLRDAVNRLRMQGKDPSWHYSFGRRNANGRSSEWNHFPI